MGDDEFAQHLAGARRHFAATLAGRIALVDACLPALTGESGEVAGTVRTAHNIVLDLCGDGPPLGFVATGQAARACQGILLQPFHDKRGLTEPEMANLRKGLVALRAAAQNDMQANSAVAQ